MLRMTGLAVVFIAILINTTGCFDEGRVPSLAVPAPAPEPAPDAQHPMPDTDVALLPGKPVQVYYVTARDGSEVPAWKQKRRIRKEMRHAQAFFASEMERHGYGPRTFGMMRANNGAIDVKDMTLEKSRAFYLSAGYTSVVEETRYKERNSPVHVYFVDIPLDDCARGNGRQTHGDAWMFRCWEWSTLAHELGHAFDLDHDFADTRRLMGYGYAHPERYLSAGSAKWLSYHHIFTRADVRHVIPRHGLSIIEKPNGWQRSPRQARFRLKLLYKEPPADTWLAEIGLHQGLHLPQVTRYRYAVLLKRGWGDFPEVIAFSQKTTRRIERVEKKNGTQENAVYLFDFPITAAERNTAAALHIIGTDGIPLSRFNLQRK